MIFGTSSGLGPWICEQICSRQAILFLGAGSSLDGKMPDGSRPLDSEKLKASLSDAFLGGEHKEDPLRQIAEYSKFASSEHHVFQHVRDLYIDALPGKAHSLIPAFPWKAIISTNYDLLVEKAYENAGSSASQQVHAVIKDNDLSDALQEPNGVPLFKLHGSISAIGNDDPSLILATEEYAFWDTERSDLFRTFKEWLHDYPVIFCGYNIHADQHIANIFWRTGHHPRRRTHCAIVDPKLSRHAKDYYNSLRVYPIPKRFGDFMECLDADIPIQARQLQLKRSGEAHPLKRHIPSSDELPEDIAVYTHQSIELVRRGQAPLTNSPQRFYSGHSMGWDGILNSFNVERRVESDILESIEDFWLQQPKQRLNVLVGPAGSGKSVSLRSIAINLAKEDLMPVFWIDQNSSFNAGLVSKLIDLVAGPVALIIDNILDFSDEVVNLLESLQDSKGSLCIVAGARSNEWAISAAELSNSVSIEYQLTRLSEPEIRTLLTKMRQFGSLGHLASFSEDQQFKTLRDYCQRQILVALHQATKGEPLEKIVEDEFRRITPVSAQDLYLDICVINSFNVSARAGLISRISNITIAEFRERFLKPLHDVVRISFGARFADYVYSARHAEIAKLVTQRVLTDPNKRAARLARVIQHMNLSYESDQTAFSKLIRGRALAKEFASRGDAEIIMNAAFETSAQPGYLYHQFAIFEMKHSDGSLNTALRYIDKAIEEHGYSTAATLHTRGNIFRLMAKAERNPSKFQILSSEAERIFSSLLKGSDTAAPHITLAALYMEQLKRALKEGDDSESHELNEVPILTERLEQTLSSARSKFPKDAQVQMLESDFYSLIGDNPRVVEILERAYSKDKANGLIASRLARIFLSKGNSEAAEEILRTCLELNPQSREANDALADLLLKTQSEEAAAGEVISALNRVFSPGDANIETQAQCARLEYLYGNRQRAKRIFDTLKGLRLPPFRRSRIKKVIKNANGQNLRFRGTVRKRAESFGFVECPELSDSIYIGKAHNTKLWDTIKLGRSIEFSLAFTLLGPVAIQANELN